MIRVIAQKDQSNKKKPTQAYAIPHDHKPYSNDASHLVLCLHQACARVYISCLCNAKPIFLFSDIFDSFCMASCYLFTGYKEIANV